MLPEGNQRRREPAVELLVDATRPACAMPLFGMSLVERVLRAALEAGLGGSRVWLQEEGGAPTPLPADLLASLDVVREKAGPELAPRIVARASEAETLLVVEGDAVVDPRLLAHLTTTEGSRAAAAAPPRPACGRPSAVLRLEGSPTTQPAGRDLAELAAAWVADGTLVAESVTRVPPYLKKLRRDVTAYGFRIDGQPAIEATERFLFESNYKGSTDFFTKHVYPPLVWAMLRPLARHRVHPNWISVFNVLITFAAIPLFASGSWFLGLTFAYTMSVLDSVDGKLARLTYRSSKVGHVLDHGLDVVHPPLWYLAWAQGLQDPVLWTAGLWLLGAYVADRLVTEAFTRVTGGRSIHAWAEIDVRARTFISRRNINVPIFTVGLLLGVPAAAFMIVVAWQVATLAFHGLRLGAVVAELRSQRDGSPAT